MSTGTTAVYRAVLRGTYRRHLNIERHQELKTERPSSANHKCYALFALIWSWIFVITQQYWCCVYQLMFAVK